MLKLLELLAFAKAQHASDMVLSPHAPVRLRIRGEWRQLECEALGIDDVIGLFGLESAQVKALLKDNTHLCTGISFANPTDGYLRLLLYENRSILRAALRLLTAPLSQNQLPLPELTERLSQSGLILIQGGKGSGRSTTASALIDYLNQHTVQHIVTLESPIEVRYENAKALVEQWEVKTPEEIITALRETLPRIGVDTVYIDSIGNSDILIAIMNAIAAGITVIATHTGKSIEDGLQRLIDLFSAVDRHSAQRQLGDCLNSVWHQSLNYSENKEAHQCAVKYQRLLVEKEDRELLYCGEFSELSGVKCGEVICRAG